MPSKYMKKGELSTELFFFKLERDTQEYEKIIKTLESRHGDGKKATYETAPRPSVVTAKAGTSQQSPAEGKSRLIPASHVDTHPNQIPICLSGVEGGVYISIEGIPQKRWWMFRLADGFLYRLDHDELPMGTHRLGPFNPWSQLRIHLYARMRYEQGEGQKKAKGKMSRIYETLYYLVSARANDEVLTIMRANSPTEPRFWELVCQRAEKIFEARGVSSWTVVSDMTPLECNLLWVDLSGDFNSASFKLVVRNMAANLKLLPSASATIV